MAVDANDILSIRADLGFVNYGQEDIRICITLPCRVSGEITTSNDILVFGIGPEIGTGQGRIRLYTGASIGLAYFSTSSSVQGTDSDLEPFASSTNYDDLTFAWQAGPECSFGSGTVTERVSRSICLRGITAMAKRAT